MADWSDIISFVAILAFFGGIIYGVLYIINKVSQGVQSTKEALHTKGLDISKTGVSVKTSRRFNREDYVDATQRGFIKAMNASSFGPSDGSPHKVLATPMKRRTSNSSVKTNGSAEEKKKKGVLGLRRAHSNKESN